MSNVFAPPPTKPHIHQYTAHIICRREYTNRLFSCCRSGQLKLDVLCNVYMYVCNTLVYMIRVLNSTLLEYGIKHMSICLYVCVLCVLLRTVPLILFFCFFFIFGSTVACWCSSGGVLCRYCDAQHIFMSAVRFCGHSFLQTHTHTTQISCVVLSLPLLPFPAIECTRLCVFVYVCGQSPCLGIDSRWKRSNNHVIKFMCNNKLK